MRGRESEGSGIAGGRSWLAGDWSTGAGEDLGMSREEITEGERGKEKQKQLVPVKINELGGKVLHYSKGQNVHMQTLRVLPHKWQRTFLPGLQDLVGSCRAEQIDGRCC